MQFSWRFYLEPRAGDVASTALKVNNNGVVVGSSSPTGIYDDINGIYDTYAVYWKDGVIHELPSLGGQNSEATHINNAGVIVGTSQRADGTWAACRWVDGVPEDLGPLPGYLNSWSRAINSDGRIAVNSTVADASLRNTGLWDSGVFTVVAGFPGRPNTTAYGINALDQIVGMSFESYDPVTGYVGRSALLWDDGVTYDLNDLIPADSGWFLRYARDINDRGQIVVRGRDALTGQNANFLLTPVPILTPVLSGDATADITYDRYGNVGGSAAGLGVGYEMVGGTAMLDNFQLTGSYATMMLFYEEEDLAYRGILEESLRLYWYNGALAQWVLAGNNSNLAWNPLAQFVLGGPTGVLGDWGLNMADNYVWANIDHASTYGMAGQAQVPAPGAFLLGMLGVAGLALFRRRL